MVGCVWQPRVAQVGELLARGSKTELELEDLWVVHDYHESKFLTDRVEEHYIKCKEAGWKRPLEVREYESTRRNSLLTTAIISSCVQLVGGRQA